MQEINLIDIIFSIGVLIMSIVVHEVSHGYAAFMLGDSTAKYAGRLTLNPIKHLDFFGSFIVPLLSYSLGGVIFGWAKPVPYNPYNLKNQRWGPGLVGVAGPLSNFFIAIIFGLILRFYSYLTFLPSSFFEIASLIVFINILLAVFNMVPIPPLDGSKVLFAVLPYKWHNIQMFLERYGLILVVFFIFFLFQIILPLVYVLFNVITGARF